MVTAVDRLALTGKVIASKYRVERMLGEGGAGIVYQGVNLILNERVAIKCIKPSENAADPHGERTFLKEAKLLFTLAHPGIVRMYDVGEVDTVRGRVPYVVLEFIDGVSLEDDVKRRAREKKPYTPLEIEAVMLRVLEAVTFAHERGVVHRDLKPSNVMLVGDQVKVLDFGTARSGDQATRLTTQFTPRYAAPEQWDPSRGDRGPWTDVYALGLVLYEMGVLAPAMSGDDVPSLIHATMSDIRPSFRAVRPELSPTFDGILARSLAIAPSARFRNGGEMMAAIRAAPKATPRSLAMAQLASTAPLPADPARPLSTAHMPARPPPTHAGTLPLSAGARQLMAGTLPLEGAGPLDLLPRPRTPTPGPMSTVGMPVSPLVAGGPQATSGQRPPSNPGNNVGLATHPRMTPAQRPPQAPAAEAAPASKAWIAWIVVGVLLVLLAVAGYFAVRGRGVAELGSHSATSLAAAE